MIDKPIHFDFSVPVRLHFGEGLIDRMAAFCPGARRVLLVTGRGFAGKSGLTDRVCAGFRGGEVEVFDEVEPNPSIETLERGAEVARQAGSDLVVGLGGGSAMDAAKCIAALARNDGGFHELLAKETCEHAPVRLIAIPTTCGTGSEANRYAIITDTKLNDKVTFAGPRTYPAIGILDPTVLDGMPTEILVDTACDAFTHAFEGYTSRRAQPFTDILAMEAMSIIVRSLGPAAEGRRESKADLLYAASMAGIVIDHTATTMLHAMGYYLTLRHGVPHGRANAALLPVLFTYLEREIPDRIRNVYEIFPSGMRGAEGVGRWIRGLGIKTSPAAYGMDASEIDQFTDYVLGKKNTARTVGSIGRELLARLMAENWR